MPKMAGVVPNTGTVLMRKFGIICNPTFELNQKDPKSPLLMEDNITMVY